MAINEKPIFGVRSLSGTKLLDCDPFELGAQIPLAKGEELFLYTTRHALADATRQRDLTASVLPKILIWMALLTVQSLMVTGWALWRLGGVW